MIHVTRRKREGEVLKGRSVAAARRAAKAFFDQPKRNRPGSFAFDDELLARAEEPLKKLFRGKCAYCEQRFIKDEKICIDRFRPAGDARQKGERPSPDHYWWLAYEWTNLYPACATCHRNKGTTFPVQRRAPIGASGQELLDEGALLLDPCVDDPQNYFYFLRNGRVMPSGKLPKDQRERAATTIEVLRLNRRELRRPRAQAMEEAAVACETLNTRRRRLLGGTGAVMSHPVSRVRRALRGWLPFGAARRQAARETLEGFGNFGQQVISLVPELASPADRARRAELRRQGRVRRLAYVKELSVRNFKAIRQLRLTFGTPNSGDTNKRTTASWMVFLGENGAGKSSLLQALALALSGELETNLALVNWDKLLLRPRGKRRRPAQGYVKVVLSTDEELELRFTNKKAWFVSGAEGARTSIRAYGPTRNLPNTRAPASWKSVEAMIRVLNLFDSNSPLVSAEGWMAGLSAKRFKVVAKTVNTLLNFESPNGLRRERRKLDDRTGDVPVVDIGNSTSRLDELSDGYQSMIALAADIMAGLPKNSTDFEKESGIVLIDELGNHLHPSWLMRVVGSLRRAFPCMQFIASTHEPLCLRGVREGETVLLRSNANGRVEAETDLPSPADFRVDQLLTSDFFGLNSTVDVEAEDLFNEYYALLALPRRRPGQARRVEQLRAQLKDRRHLGATLREDLLYNAIDQLVARHRFDAAIHSADLNQAAVDAVSRIWNAPVPTTESDAP